MRADELRKTFLRFFQKKGHKIIASSPLIPADSTSLFTSAGMQQFVPELSGKVKPKYKKVCSVQKCFRVNDIDEVGDATHHTFFEMLGNWSFGDYFKQEAIDWALEFLLKELKIKKEKIWVTIFKGEKGIAKDKQSFLIWQKKGIKKQKIFEFGMKDNFWGPVSKTGPCGPCSEIFYDLTGKPCQKGKKCGPNCDCNRFVEIWNLVFMEYDKDEKGDFQKLKKHNVDTGIGFERLLSILQNKDSAYETDLFGLLIQEIERQTKKKYKHNKKEFRILADHLRAEVFLISEGILPSNLDRGYVLRRILRRSIRYAKVLDLPKDWYVKPIKIISEIYNKEYPELQAKQKSIIAVIQKEQEKFSRALKKGLKELEELLTKNKSKIISGKDAFFLYQSYGFPLEFTQELAKEKGALVDQKGFEKALCQHRGLSRAGAQKKFGGIGIANLETKEQKEKAVKLHTATHLLHSALRQILGKEARQMGSDITPERLRFDFSFSRKLEKSEIEKVEQLVNQKIKQDIEVKKQEMSYEQAQKSGALAFFKEKYPAKVNVYSIDNFSKEICAGPHAKTTSILGVFKIIREKSAAAGIRRIRAVLE